MKTYKLLKDYRRCPVCLEITFDGESCYNCGFETPESKQN